MAAAAPFLKSERPSPHARPALVLPRTFRGMPLHPDALSETEQRVLSSSATSVHRFTLGTSGEEQVVLRTVHELSRTVHPAEECFEAQGFTLEPEPLSEVAVPELAPHPLRWSQFSYRDGERRYLVRQTLFSLAHGESFNPPSISEWYWRAFFLRASHGPWLAVTWRVPFPDWTLPQEY